MRNLDKLYDPRIIERIKKLRLMDDELMTRVFSDDIEATQFLLRILLHDDTLKVLKSHCQSELKNIFGRSIKLDILAEDENHNLINVEIQKDSKGANPKRARFHAAMIDSHFLQKGEKFDDLKTTYIIFITEHDVWGKGHSIYTVNKTISGTNLPFEDYLHIIYVNGTYRGNDAIGILMHDFCCMNTSDMKYKELADKVDFYKQKTGGTKIMWESFSDLIEEFVQEERIETKEEMVIEMLKKNLDLQTISDIAKFSIEEIKQIAQKRSIPA